MSGPGLGALSNNMWPGVCHYTFSHEPRCRHWPNVVVYPHFCAAFLCSSAQALVCPSSSMPFPVRQRSCFFFFGWGKLKQYHPSLYPWRVIFKPRTIRCFLWILVFVQLTGIRFIVVFLELNNFWSTHSVVIDAMWWSNIWRMSKNTSLRGTSPNISSIILIISRK